MFQGISKERVLLAVAAVVVAAAVVTVVYVLCIGREKLVNGKTDFAESVAGVVGIAAAFL